jgi:hypothetical protein
MTITSKVKPPKLDKVFQEYLDNSRSEFDIDKLTSFLDKKIVPKTLQEIYDDVGLPFVAKAVVNLQAPETDSMLPVGTELKINTDPMTFRGTRFFLCRDIGYRITADTPRWVLIFKN